MNAPPEVVRYTAFTTDPEAGNPAGVVLDARGLGAAQMLAIAADVGYSETAFLLPEGGDVLPVRYFSPLAEVPFCGHATIALGVAWGERNGLAPLRLMTQSGEVGVRLSDSHGTLSATLVSVAPEVRDPEPGVRPRLLQALRYAEADLDDALPLRVGFAGAWHPIVALRTRDRLAALDYDYEVLAALMAEQDWTTVNVVWRESEQVFHSRNPFPPGGVVEDPATGAAAAALGGYLREHRLVELPASVAIRQGVDMGRPSLLTVGIEAEGGISVTGNAVPIR